MQNARMRILIRAPGCPALRARPAWPVRLMAGSRPCRENGAAAERPLPGHQRESVPANSGTEMVTSSGDTSDTTNALRMVTATGAVIFSGAASLSFIAWPASAADVAGADRRARRARGAGGARLLRGLARRAARRQDAPWLDGAGPAVRMGTWLISVVSRSSRRGMVCRSAVRLRTGRRSWWPAAPRRGRYLLLRRRVHHGGPAREGGWVMAARTYSSAIRPRGARTTTGCR